MSSTRRPNTTSAGENASSWSEMIKSVELSKKTLPWQKDDFVPTTRIPLPEVRRNKTNWKAITCEI